MQGVARAQSKTSVFSNRPSQMRRPILPTPRWASYLIKYFRAVRCWRKMSGLFRDETEEDRISVLRIPTRRFAPKASHLEIKDPATILIKHSHQDSPTHASTVPVTPKTPQNARFDKSAIFRKRSKTPGFNWGTISVRNGNRSTFQRFQDMGRFSIFRDLLD